MAKPLSELLNRVDPDVIRAAEEQAQEEILALKLTALREQLELTQTEVATKLDISQPSVANLESRGEEIKLSTLKRYVEALGGTLSLDIELPDGRHIGLDM
jgi:transcriptional regulator with XRE-family HTH domain